LRPIAGAPRSAYYSPEICRGLELLQSFLILATLARYNERTSFVDDETFLTMTGQFRALDEVELPEFFGLEPSATVSHEGADRMVVRDGKLRCEFSTAGEKKTTLTIETGRSLSVAWSSLRTE
jgi:hypothetical protein